MFNFFKGCGVTECTKFDSQQTNSVGDYLLVSGVYRKQKTAVNSNTDTEEYVLSSYYCGVGYGSLIIPFYIVFFRFLKNIFMETTSDRIILKFGNRPFWSEKFQNFSLNANILEFGPDIRFLKMLLASNY